MQRYETYYPVDFDYVNELPAHWQLIPNIAIFSLKQDRNHPAEELLSVSSYKGIVKTSSFEDRKDRSSEDKSQYQLVEPGEIVYNPMLMWAGAVGYSEHKGIVSPDYNVLKAKIPINPKFFHYQFRSEFYKNYVKRFSHGIVASRLRLYFNKFKRLYSIVPPLEVQDEIVRFIERKQAEIESLIEKKNRLLSVLKEERLAIINKHLPTDGKTIKIKYLLNGIIDTEHKTVNFEESGKYLVVRTSNIKDGNLTLNNAKYTDEKGFRDWTRRGIPKPGDLLLTREAPAGEACIVPDKIDLCIGQRVVWLQVNTSKLDPTFALHSIYATPAQKFIYDLSGGSTVAHLNMSEIGNIPVLDISPAEQKAIGKKINLELDRIEKVNQKTVTEIEKSTELLSWYFENLIRGQFRGLKSTETSFSIAAEPNSEYGIKEQ